MTLLQSLNTSAVYSITISPQTHLNCANNSLTIFRHLSNSVFGFHSSSNFLLSCSVCLHSFNSILPIEQQTSLTGNMKVALVDSQRRAYSLNDMKLI